MTQMIFERFEQVFRMSPQTLACKVLEYFNHVLGMSSHKPSVQQNIKITLDWIALMNESNGDENRIDDLLVAAKHLPFVGPATVDLTGGITLWVECFGDSSTTWVSED